MDLLARIPRIDGSALWEQGLNGLGNCYMAAGAAFAAYLAVLPQGLQQQASERHAGAWKVGHRAARACTERPWRQQRLRTLAAAAACCCGAGRGLGLPCSRLQPGPRHAAGSSALCHAAPPPPLAHAASLKRPRPRRPSPAAARQLRRHHGPGLVRHSAGHGAAGAVRPAAAGTRGGPAAAGAAARGAAVAAGGGKRRRRGAGRAASERASEWRRPAPQAPRRPWRRGPWRNTATGAAAGAAADSCLKAPRAAQQLAEAAARGEMQQRNTRRRRERSSLEASCREAAAAWLLLAAAQHCRGALQQGKQPGALATTAPAPPTQLAGSAQQQALALALEGPWLSRPGSVLLCCYAGQAASLAQQLAEAGCHSVWLLEAGDA
jgi:hypothetical protein